MEAIADSGRALFDQVDWPVLGILVGSVLLFWLLRDRNKAAEERDLYRKGFSSFGRHKKACPTKSDDIDDCECGYAEFLRELRGDD